MSQTKREQFETLLHAFEATVIKLSEEMDKGTNWNAEHAARTARNTARAELVEFINKEMGNAI